MWQLRTETEFKVSPQTEIESRYLDPEEKVLQSPMPKVYSLKNLGVQADQYAPLSIATTNLPLSKTHTSTYISPKQLSHLENRLVGKNQSSWLPRKPCLLPMLIVQESLIRVKFGQHLRKTEEKEKGT